MTDNIDVVVKEQGSTAVVQSFDAVAAAAKRAHTDVSALQKLLGNVGRSTAAANRITALGAAAHGATGHVANLTSAMQALNNTRVTSNLNSANTALGGTATQANSAAIGMRNLVAAFLSFQAVRGVVASLIEAQVSMQQIHYGLLAATGSARSATEQFEFLERTSEKLGTNLKSSAMEYTRLAAAASAMNVKVEDQQRLYEGLSKAATVLHLDQQKMQFATLALTQMFSKGKIQSEELRRQLGEAVPGAAVRFQKAVMESIKGTELQGESFESLMKKGKLVTSQFLPQLIQALEETGRGWEHASVGLNAEINRLSNAWFKLKIELSEGLFSQVTISVVRFLANNMKELTGLVAALGVTIAIAFAPAVLTPFIAQLKVLWALVLANPFFAIAAAIAGVVTYIGFMRDEIKLGIDETTTLGDLLRAIWEQITPVVQAVAGTIEQLFINLKIWWGDAFGDMSKKAAESGRETEAVWLQMARWAARTVDAILGLFLGLYDGIKRIFSSIGDAFMNNMAQLKSAKDSLLEGDFGGVMEAAKKNLAGWKSVGTDIGKNLRDGMDVGFGAMKEGGLEARLDAAILRAQQISKARLAKPTGGDTGGGGTGFTPTPTSGDSDTAKKAKELDRLKDALARVIGEIDPTQDALRRLAEAQEVLNKSVAAGLITQDKATWVMERLTAKYREQLDPVGFLIDKYKEEREVLKYVGDEQQVMTEVLRITNDLKKKNYEVTTAQVAAIKAEVEATQQAKRENEAYNQVLQQTIYARRAELEHIRAIGQARADGRISEGMASQQAVEIFGADAMMGTQEYFNMVAQGYTDMMAKIEAARQANIISEQTAQKLQTDAYLTQLNARLDVAGKVFGQLSQLQHSENKKMARVGKAAAIAQALIATYTGATEAYKSMAGIPYVGPALGVAAAAAAVAAGLANVSAIRSQGDGFRTGGNFQVGGSGGPDTQLVQFWATPGEHVQVNTPAQARAAEEGGGSTVVNSPISVAVVQDREAAFAQMRQDPNMRQWIIEVIEENNGTVARAIGVK